MRSVFFFILFSLSISYAQEPAPNCDFWYSPIKFISEKIEIRKVEKTELLSDLLLSYEKSIINGDQSRVTKVILDSYTQRFLVLAENVTELLDLYRSTYHFNTNAYASSLLNAVKDKIVSKMGASVNLTVEKYVDGDLVLMNRTGNGTDLYAKLQEELSELDANIKVYLSPDVPAGTTPILDGDRLIFSAHDLGWFKVMEGSQSMAPLYHKVVDWNRVKFSSDVRFINFEIELINKYLKENLVQTEKVSMEGFTTLLIKPVKSGGRLNKVAQILNEKYQFKMVFDARKNFDLEGKSFFDGDGKTFFVSSQDLISDQLTKESLENLSQWYNEIKPSVTQSALYRALSKKDYDGLNSMIKEKMNNEKILFEESLAPGRGKMGNQYFSTTSAKESMKTLLIFPSIKGAAINQLAIKLQNDISDKIVLNYTPNITKFVAEKGARGIRKSVYNGGLQIDHVDGKIKTIRIHLSHQNMIEGNINEAVIKSFISDVLENELIHWPSHAHNSPFEKMSANNMELISIYLKLNNCKNVFKYHNEENYKIVISGDKNGSRLNKIAGRLQEVHGSNLIYDWNELERINALGFYSPTFNEVATSHHSIRNIFMDTVLSHEIRHSFYNNMMRGLKKNTLYNAQLHAVTGVIDPYVYSYTKYMSLEEMSTHSQDLHNYAVRLKKAYKYNWNNKSKLGVIKDIQDKASMLNGLGLQTYNAVDRIQKTPNPKNANEFLKVFSSEGGVGLRITVGHKGDIIATTYFLNSSNDLVKYQFTFFNDEIRNKMETREQTLTAMKDIFYEVQPLIEQHMAQMKKLAEDITNVTSKIKDFDLLSLSLNDMTLINDIYRKARVPRSLTLKQDIDESLNIEN